MLSKILLVILSLFLFHSNALAECVTVGLIEEWERPKSKTTFPYGSELEAGANLAQKLFSSDPLNSTPCLVFKKIDIKNSLANIEDAIDHASQSGISLFLGLGTSDKVQVAIKALKKTNSILISPTATSDSLVGKNQRTILMSPRNSLIAMELARNVIAVDIKNISIIYAENSIYSSDMAQVFKKEFEKRGGSIKSMIPIQAGRINLAPHIQEINQDESHLFLPLFELDVAHIVNYLALNGVKKKYIGSDSWGTYSEVILKLTKEYEFSAILPVIYSADYESNANTKFIEAYSQMTNKKNPSDTAAFACEGVLLYKKMLAVCSLEKLRTNPYKCLKKSLPFSGLGEDINSSSYLSLNRILSIKKFSENKK